MNFINTHIFFIIFFIISLIFFIFALICKNKNIKIINLSCFSIFFTLSVIEFCLSFQFPDINLVPYDNKIFDIKIDDINDLKKEHVVLCNENDEKIFYKNDDIEQLDNKDVVYDVKYTLYQNNIRYTQSNDNSSDMYIFMGCSFVFGEGLNDKETLPYFFSKKFNFNKHILNLGIRGKSTNTALSILRKDIIDQFKKNSTVKHVFYVVFADYFRNFRIANNTTSDNWIFKNDNWKRTKQPYGFIKIIFAKSYIFMTYCQILLEQHYIPLYKKYFIDSLYEIGQIVKQKYDADFTIVIYPNTFFNFYELNNATLNKILLDEKFYTSSLYKIDGDGHPNARANEEIADILFNYITKNYN